MCAVLLVFVLDVGFCLLNRDLDPMVFNKSLFISSIIAIDSLSVNHLICFWGCFGEFNGDQFSVWFLKAGIHEFIVSNVTEGDTGGIIPIHGRIGSYALVAWCPLIKFDDAMSFQVGFNANY